MYLKLALKNVKKSYQDFLVYFMTLSFSVCLFYTFNTFQDQKAVIQISSSQDDLVTQLSGVMLFISIFVAMILSFLILYANNFLMKRRKKEFGLYMLLGMPRSKISHILIYETLMIGIISLITGILTGLFLSQILTAITANLFEATLNYHFVFSTYSLIITLFSFFFIFFLVIMFQTWTIRRKQLIDFIKPEKQEQGRVKKLWLSILIFILSILFLASAYVLALIEPYQAFNMLDIIIVLGSIGTILFFLSLSGFLLSLIHSSKRLYFRNLNCFVLRQLSSSVNTSFLIMSILCIMLLLSIGALATGLNLKNTINRTLEASTPYDFSFYVQYFKDQDDKLHHQDFDLRKYQEELGMDPSLIKESHYMTIYQGDLDFQQVDTSHINQKKDTLLDTLIQEKKASVPIIPLSSYNQVMRDTHQKELILQQQEGYLYYDSEVFRQEFEELLSTSPTLTWNDAPIHIINRTYDKAIMFTTPKTDTNSIYLVLPDERIPSDTMKSMSICNINLMDGVSSEDYYNAFTKQLTEMNKGTKLDMSKYPYLIFSWYDANSIRVNSAGMSVSFTYIGIYLGIVFLIASAAILALQLLSQAEENRQRYAILSKLGTEESMQNKAILLQLGLYFLLPLSLAIIHSIVGIQLVNSLVAFLGKGDIVQASFMTAGFFLLIYGAYFFLTYSQYKRILRHG